MCYGVLIISAANFDVNNPGSRNQIHAYKGKAKAVSLIALIHFPYKQPLTVVRNEN